MGQADGEKHERTEGRPHFGYGDIKSTVGSCSQEGRSSHAQTDGQLKETACKHIYERRVF